MKTKWKLIKNWKQVFECKWTLVPSITHEVWFPHHPFSDSVDSNNSAQWAFPQPPVLTDEAVRRWLFPVGVCMCEWCGNDCGGGERADNEGRGRSVSDSTGYGIQVAQSFRSVPSSADSWLLLLDRENLFLGKCVSFHKIIYWMYTICINKSN